MQVKASLQVCLLARAGVLEGSLEEDQRTDGT